MPRKKTYAVSTIHRAHLAYIRDEGPHCVNMLHECVDCFSAELHITAYCESCRQHMLRNNPTIVLNDVRYVMDYGKGFTKPLFTIFCDVPVKEPVYVWRCWDMLDYTAPPHAANHLWELLDIVEEMAMAEVAAGWDPNP